MSYPSLAINAATMIKHSMSYVQWPMSNVVCNVNGLLPVLYTNYWTYQNIQYMLQMIYKSIYSRIHIQSITTQMSIYIIHSQYHVMIGVGLLYNTVLFWQSRLVIMRAHFCINQLDECWHIHDIFMTLDQSATLHSVNPDITSKHCSTCKQPLHSKMHNLLN